MIELIDCHTHIGTDYYWHNSGVCPSSQTLNELLTKLEYNDVSKAIVFPMASSPYYTYKSLGSDKPVVSGAEKYPYLLANDYLLNEIDKLNCLVKRKFYPFLCFTPQAEISKQLIHLEALIPVS